MDGIERDFPGVDAADDACFAPQYEGSKAGAVATERPNHVRAGAAKYSAAAGCVSTHRV
jgi:hypothetical protein